MSSPYNIQLNTPYEVRFAAKGNGQRRRKSRFHGRTVVVKENNPTNSDIPSFEHGNTHIYDALTDKYYGCCGVLYFAETIGIEPY